jgi:hypothetical protein
MRSRSSVTLLAGLGLVVAALVLPMSCGPGGSSSGNEAANGPRDTSANAPTQSPSQVRGIAGFLAEPSIPDDVKERFIATLNNGSLAAERFHVASGSWRRCSASCTGRVKSATASSLTLEAMVDGREWTIGLSGATSITRGGARIAPSDLRNGEVVEALSQDGVTAMLVLSFSQ